jgi:twitching motility protein PilJ
MNPTSAAPGTGHRFNFLLRLRLWQKFALLGAVAFALAAFPVWQLVKSVEQSIDRAQSEGSGLAAITATLEMVRTLQDHRASASYAVLGDQERGAPQARNAAEADAALAKLEAITTPLQNASVNERLASFKKNWTAMKESIAAHRIDQRAVAEGHIGLIGDMLHLIEELSAIYKIDLDADPATYYMARSTLVDLPLLSESLGELRSPVVSRLQEIAAARAGDPQRLDAALREAMRPADRSRIAQTVKDVQDSLDRYVANQKRAMQALPELEATSGAQVAEIQRATSQAIALVQRDILGKEVPTIEPAAYLKAVSEPREVVQKAATLQELLERQLKRRVDAARADRLKTVAGVLALLALAAAISWLIVRNITTTVSGLQRSVERVRSGDTGALQSIESRDEVGELGRTVNSLLQERIAAQEASEEAARRAEAENERLNNSVISILQAVNQLSQRDLTARAPVTQDIIGTVSD